VKSFFRKNLGLKAFSLLLTIVLWSSIVSRAPEVGTFRIPIEFDTSDDQILVDSELREAEVRLEGDTTALSRVPLANLHALVSVKNLSAGPHTLVIVPDEIQRVPRGITKVEVLTSGFKITLDTRRTALLPVVIRRAGEVPQGYSVINISVQPTDVEVSGPASSFEGIGEIPTESLDLSQEKASFTRLVKLVPQGRLMRAAPSSVRVSVEIEELATTEQLLLQVIPSIEGWTAEPAQVTATLEAPPSLLPRLKEALSARILVDNLPAAAGGEPVVTLDWGPLDIAGLPRVQVVEISPSRVHAHPPRSSR